MKRFFAYSAVVTALIGLLIVRSVEGGTFLHNPTAPAAALAADWAYDGPFAVTVKPGSTNGILLIGNGAIYAGDDAQAYWPDWYSTNTGAGQVAAFVSADGSDGVHVHDFDDGEYYLLMNVSVTNTTGYFHADAGRHPRFSIPEASTISSGAVNQFIQDKDLAAIILAFVEIVGGQVTSIRQDQRSHIYVPVHKDVGNKYHASWYIKVPTGT